MDLYEKIKREILDILQQNPEELKHAINTLNWLFKIKPDSDYILIIAALSHDIERVIYGKVKTPYNPYDTYKGLYKEFKKAHSKRSAEIVKSILIKHGMDGKEVERTENIINNHEFGGNNEIDLIKDSDSLANFQWCDDMFRKKDINSLRRTMERMYKRMEPENRKFINQINFANHEIKSTIDEISQR